MYTCTGNALFSELLLQVPLHQRSLVLETFGLVGHKASQQASWLIHLAATENQLDRESDTKHALLLHNDPHQTAVSHVRGIKNSNEMLICKAMKVIPHGELVKH